VAAAGRNENRRQPEQEIYPGQAANPPDEAFRVGPIACGDATTKLRPVNNIDIGVDRGHENAHGGHLTDVPRRHHKSTEADEQHCEATDEERNDTQPASEKEAPKHSLAESQPSGWIKGPPRFAARARVQPDMALWRSPSR